VAFEVELAFDDESVDEELDALERPASDAPPLRPALEAPEEPPPPTPPTDIPPPYTLQR
jgi:hypothetical protein